MQSAVDSPGTVITLVFTPAQFTVSFYSPWWSADAFSLADTNLNVILAVCMFQECKGLKITYNYCLSRQLLKFNVMFDVDCRSF